MARRKRIVSKRRYVVKEPTQQDIQKLAYKFFEERGYQHGWDLDDWLKAERMLKTRR